MLGTIFSTLIFLQGLRTIAEERQLGYIPSPLAYIVLDLLFVLPIGLWIVYLYRLVTFLRQRRQVEVELPPDRDVWPPPPRR
jgi:hypothetical protein